jgi:hypothetical protein
MPLSPEIASSIDNLMRRDLDVWANAWFWVLVVSTLIVVVGLICEAPEVLHAVGFGHKTIPRVRTFWYIHVRKIDLNGWEQLCPELVADKSVNVKRIARWGLVGWSLVAAGVAGEGFAEYWVNDAETNLRAFEEGALIETQQSANSAAAASSLANTFANKAITSVSKAQHRIDRLADRANDITASLNKAQSDLEDAYAVTRELQDSMMDRALPVTYTGNSPDFGPLLNPFKDQKISVLWEANAETRRAAAGIKQVLDGAKWSVSKFTEYHAIFPEGVMVFAGKEGTDLVAPKTQSILAADALVRYLRAKGWEAMPSAGSILKQLFNLDLATDEIVVIVGPKPHPDLEEAEHNEWMDVHPVNPVVTEHQRQIREQRKAERRRKYPLNP